MANMFDEEAPIMNNAPSGNMFDDAGSINKAAEPTQFQDNFSPELEGNKPGFIAGLERGAATRLLGAGQMLNDTGAGKYLGVPSKEDLSGGVKQANIEGKNTGIAGAAGELLGDPVNYLPMGEAIKGANIGAKSLAKIGAKQGFLSGISAPTENDKSGLGERALGTVESTATGAILAPVIGRGINKSFQPKFTPNQPLNITNISTDAPFLNATQGVKDVYNAEKGRETALWNKAKEAGNTTTLHPSAIFPEIKNNVETVLNQNAKSLSNDDMKPLSTLLDKLDKFEAPEVAPPTTDPFTGQVIPSVSKPAEGVPLSDLIAIRRGISGLAGKSSDGVLRNASGKALKEFDKALDDASQYAVMSGDEKAIDKFNKAREQSKSIFEKFGTSHGETAAFQNIITNNKLTNAQIVDAFGTTARGNQSTAQTIGRMLDNAGSSKDKVQKNLADGYLYRAIRRSTNTVNAEDVINPQRMRTEIDRIVSGNRMEGLDKDTRDLIFSPQQIQDLKTLKNNIKDGKNLTGKITQWAASKIPLASGVISKSDVAAAKNARGQVEKFINPPVKNVLDTFRGQPMYYGAMFTGAQAGKPSSEQ